MTRDTFKTGEDAMSSEHVTHLQRMANESWRGSPEHAALTAAIAALSAPKPEGEWVLVPREPTPEMLSAAGRLQACECGFIGDMSPMDGEEYAAMLAAAPQPPAEAQPVACDEDRFEQFLQAAIARSPEPLRELGEYLAGVLDDDQWPAADRLLLQLATSTPSSSVGVEGVRHEIQNALRELDAVMTTEDNTSDAVGCAELALQRALEALAQQPAAVDEAMVRRALCVWFGDPSGNGLDRGVPTVEEWFKRMKAALTAALAAQPGGSDNDR